MIEPRWPFDQEIFYHLDYKPFIDLKVSFDPKPMLNEALSLLESFVEHRVRTQENKTSEGKWKSLGLRTFDGDPSKTEYHTSYTSEEKIIYKNSLLLDKCPETKKFLNSITDIDQCDRIRFMLLEPGTEIKVHSDSQRDVSFAINISLNMPEGCEFWAQLNPDGSRNDYSCKVPFHDSGSVILFNNSKYHKLKNDSQTKRIHIIFHGPIRFKDEAILQIAREQNKLFSRKEILKKLVEKKALMGESFSKSPVIIKDWKNAGLSSDSLGQNIQLIILKNEGPRSEFSLEKITKPSLFPLGFVETKSKDLDDYLNKVSTKYAVICTAGTYIKSTHQFILELWNQIRLMKEKNAIVSGHIIDHPGDAIPFFHQQFLILDVEAFKKMECRKLGPYFGEENIDFPAYNRGPDVHDNYTPSFLSVGLDIKTRTGKANWGSAFMAESLSLGNIVLNISKELRETKEYSYPLDENPEAEKKINNLILENLTAASEDVYFFNNEELNIASVKGLKPEVLISVASGFKGVKILEQYKYSSSAQITYTDFSSNSLKYLKAINGQKNFASLVQQIEKYTKFLKPSQWNEGLNQELLRGLIDMYFKGNEEYFFSFLALTEKAKYEKLNFVLQPESLLAFLPEGKSFIIWVSNAFYNNHVFHLLGVEEAGRKYHELAKLIAARKNVKAFAEKGTQNIVFGEALNMPVGFLTDGCSDKISSDEKDFILL
jgi:hypothetical protein